MCRNVLWTAVLSSFFPFWICSAVTKSQTQLKRLSSSSSSSNQETLGFPGGASSKEPACQCRRRKKCGFDPWVWKINWRRAWQSTPVFLPAESHGQRMLVGCTTGNFTVIFLKEKWWWPQIPSSFLTAAFRAIHWWWPQGKADIKTGREF